MDEIIIGIFKVQSEFALEVWFSILCLPFSMTLIGRISQYIQVYDLGE